MQPVYAAVFLLAFHTISAVRISHSSSGRAAEEHQLGPEFQKDSKGSPVIEAPHTNRAVRGARPQSKGAELQSGNSIVLATDADIDAAAESLTSLALQPGRHSLVSGDHAGSPDCKSCQGIFDYQSLLQRSLYSRLSLVALVLWACVLIWMLATTAQDFFVPPLLYWSDRLQLQPEVAGATLLALGNGAPDIFAVCTAASREDLPLALSEMLGANMFTLCVTGTAVLVACYFEYLRSCASLSSLGGLTGATIYKKLSFNDHMVPLANAPAGGFLPALDIGRFRLTIGVYLVTLGAIALILFDGHITVAKACCLPLLYLCYLIAIVGIGGDRSLCCVSPKEKSRQPRECSESKAKTPLSMLPVGFEERRVLKPKQPVPEPSHLQLLWKGVTFPVDLMRWATIPPSDSRWDNNRRLMATACPMGILAFCVLTNSGWLQALSWMSQMTLCILAFIASLTIFLTGGTGPSLPWFYPALTLAAQISSILWLAAIASELTSLIEAVGYVLQVPRIRLGFTAISWGDALGDTLTCVAMVRSGQARAALTAVFANSVLDDLLGFGLALVFMASDASGSVALWDQSGTSDFPYLLLTSFGFIVAAVFVLCSMIGYRGYCPPFWGGSLLLLYFAFLCRVLTGLA